MNGIPLTLSCVTLTIAAYALSRYVGARIKSPFTTPVFLSTALIIAGLVSAGLTPTDYAPASSLLTALLGPATVALAVPLYKNAATLKRDLLPAAAGITAGVCVTVISAVMLAQWSGLSEELVRASSAKSVTVAVAVQIAGVIDADPSLVAGFVIVTGMLGAMVGQWVLNLGGITDPASRGLAMGSIAHGQGMAQVATEGELQGAVAGVAMGVTAIASAVVLPILLGVLA